MRNKQKQSGHQTLSLSKGFSAVELLITLFIASVFLMTGFQLYAVIIKNGGEARQQASAANIAADYLQQYESSATSPCTPGTLLTSSPVSGSGLTGATVTVTVTCPNITSPTFSATGGTVVTLLTNVSKVVATVTYGNSKTVSNSTYVSTAGIVTNGLALNLDAGSTASYPAGGPTWNDLSPNGINGTLVGGVTYSAATNNGYLIFDGSTGHVTLASHPTNGPGSFSAFAWVKTGISGTRKSIIDWGSDATNGGAWLFINASNQVQMDLSGIGGPSSTATVTNSAWHHVGVVNNANTIQIYVDGVASGNPLVMSPTIGITNTPQIGVGMGGNFGNWRYSGHMGNVVVYNRALSDNEITQNYTALKGRYP